MRKDHRPYWLIKCQQRWNQFILEKKIRPQFTQLGNHPAILAPNTLQISGHHICAGNFLHLINNKQQPIKISTWNSKNQQGHINIGHYCLISPGVSLSSAEAINIGDNCMIAAEVNISDCDWHGIYNRLRPFRCTEPVEIGENVWIGLRSIICKGVSIGENSIIGAGSVVVGNIPANSIAAGNPAKVIRELNPNRRMLKREFLFRKGEDYWQTMEEINRYFSESNTTFNWLKTQIFPSERD